MFCNNYLTICFLSTPPPIRDRVDRESREKEKIHLDLEKAEKLKNQLATEVDEHHSAIEHKNNLNLR